MKIVLVGEAYGSREAVMHFPLVGPSGRELTLEMGRAGLAPFIKIRCRKCKELDSFTGNFHCTKCNEYLVPSEFNLMQHWKELRNSNQIAVTNVFNEKPPDICLECNSHNTSLIGQYRYKCNDCNSRNIQTNDLGWFFGPERETPMPPWKASKKSPGTHLKGEHYYHILRLFDEIKAYKPNLVIAMGNAACWALLNQTPKISDMRGYIDWSEKLSVKVLPTYHSAHVLRNNAFRPTCIADYKKACIEAEFPEIRRPERWLNIIDPTPEGIKKGYEWFKKPATAYANDIETFRDQITMVGFARSPHDALVIVLRDFSTDKQGNIIESGTAAKYNGFSGDNINYWPTSELEFEAWKLIQFGLNTPQEKIYQNGVYDIGYFIRMGLHPRNVRHDTMLWHHSWLPEQPKSLGYLGSLYTGGDIAWKRMRNRESLKRDE